MLTFLFLFSSFSLRYSVTLRNANLRKNVFFLLFSRIVMFSAIFVFAQESILGVLHD